MKFNFLKSITSLDFTGLSAINCPNDGNIDSSDNLNTSIDFITNTTILAFVYYQSR